MDEAAARELLDIERAQVRERLDALTADFNGIVAASRDSNSDDEHDPEGATIAFERELVASRRAQAEAQLRHLDQARARLADGSFGTCRLCERPIPEERLRAMPGTDLCAGCAAGRNEVGRPQRARIGPCRRPTER